MGRWEGFKLVCTGHFTCKGEEDSYPAEGPQFLLCTSLKTHPCLCLLHLTSATAPVSLCPAQQCHNGTDAIHFPCHVFGTSVSIQNCHSQLLHGKTNLLFVWIFDPLRVPIPLCSASLVPPPSCSETVPNSNPTSSMLSSQTKPCLSKQPGAVGGEQSTVPPCVSRCPQVGADTWHSPHLTSPPLTSHLPGLGQQLKQPRGAPCTSPLPSHT